MLLHCCEGTIPEKEEELYQVNPWWNKTKRMTSGSQVPKQTGQDGRTLGTGLARLVLEPRSAQVEIPFPFPLGREFLAMPFLVRGRAARRAVLASMVLLANGIATAASGLSRLA
jgi:hypothetical protein